MREVKIYTTKRRNERDEEEGCIVFMVSTLEGLEKAVEKLEALGKKSGRRWFHYELFEDNEKVDVARLYKHAQSWLLTRAGRYVYLLREILVESG